MIPPGANCPNCGKRVQKGELVPEKPKVVAAPGSGGQVKRCSIPGRKMNKADVPMAKPAKNPMAVPASKPAALPAPKPLAPPSGAMKPPKVPGMPAMKAEVPPYAGSDNDKYGVKKPLSSKLVGTMRDLKAGKIPPLKQPAPTKKAE